MLELAWCCSAKDTALLLKQKKENATIFIIMIFYAIISCFAAFYVATLYTSINWSKKRGMKSASIKYQISLVNRPLNKDERNRPCLHYIPDSSAPNLTLTTVFSLTSLAAYQTSLHHSRPLNVRKKSFWIIIYQRQVWEAKTGPLHSWSHLYCALQRYSKTEKNALCVSRRYFQSFSFLKIQMCWNS